MSWRKIIKEDLLIISEILDKALPNFYHKLIQVHPDMKEALDGQANRLRTQYLMLEISEPTEEEFITEIVMLCIDVVNNSELELNYGDVPPPSLAKLLSLISNSIVKDIMTDLGMKFPNVRRISRDIVFRLVKLILLGCLFVINMALKESVKKSWEEVLKRNKGGRGRTRKKGKARKKRKKAGDNFKREKDEGLHGWFSRRGGKQKKGGKTQGGWIDCSSCGKKGGTRPCGREDASKGRKRRCRPTCAACKTYKRRKGSP